MIRPATKRDALHMAALADIAGHGMPAWVWSQACEKSQSVIEVGRARAMREEGDFSWRNAEMLEQDGEIAGMLLGYREEMRRPVVPFSGSTASGDWVLMVKEI